jgi:hypothetical protein
MGSYLLVLGNLSEDKIQPLQRHFAVQGLQFECLKVPEAAVRTFYEQYVEDKTNEEALLTEVLGIRVNEIAATLSRAECWWSYNFMPRGYCACGVYSDIGRCMSSFMLHCMPERDPRCAVMMQDNGRYFNSTGAFLQLS